MLPRPPLALALLLVHCAGNPVEVSAGGPGDDTTSSTGAPTSTTGADPTTGPAPGTSGGASVGLSTGPDDTTAALDDTTTTTATSTGEATSTGAPASTGSETTADETTGEPLALTMQHVQVKGTHNSYHVEPLVPFDKTHEYSHKPLDQQLESQGVRAFELDVHQGLGDFEVYHISVIDSSSTCDGFDECLDVIKGWSDAHPQHLPITVWIEIKDGTGGQPIDLGDLAKMDDVVRGVFGPDQLLTPDDVQADHPSLREAVMTDGWPLLDEVRGQVLFVLLNVNDDHSLEYTDNYTSLKGRAMFARAEPSQFAQPWAAIAKLGVGDAADIAAAHAANMLIATNVCNAGDADDACFANLETAEAAGIHMLKDDFPGPVDGKSYWMDLPDGNPARCNPVTAPPGCTSALLEDL